MRPILHNAIAPLRTIAGNAQMRRLTLAAALADLSAPAYGMALTIWAFHQGGAALAAITGAVALVPAALLSPLLAVFTDRARRERVIVVSLVTRSALLLLTAAAMAFGTTLLVLAAVAAASVCARVFYPAQTALLPDITGSERELVSANALASSIENVGAVVGPMVAGFALIAVSSGAVVAVCAVGTLAAAASASRIGPTERPVSEEREPLRRAAAAGFHVIASSPPLRRAVVAYAAHVFAFGALGVTIAQLALHDLDLGEAGVGAFEAALAVGGIVGGVIAVASATTHRSDRVIRAGSVVWGLALVGAALTDAPGLVLLLLAAVGVANVLVDVAVYTCLQRVTHASVRARTTASMESITVAAVGLGMLAGGAALTFAGTPATLAAIGLGLPVVAFSVLRRHAREPVVTLQAAADS